MSRSDVEDDSPFEIPITDVFDLHSVPPRDARAITEAYLEEAFARGFRYVRIIHGRGIGVQRARVHQVLSAHPLVHSFHDDPRAHLGATLVTLTD